MALKKLIVFNIFLCFISTNFICGSGLYGSASESSETWDDGEVGLDSSWSETSEDDVPVAPMMVDADEPGVPELLSAQVLGAAVQYQMAQEIQVEQEYDNACRDHYASQKPPSQLRLVVTSDNDETPLFDERAFRKADGVKRYANKKSLK